MAKASIVNTTSTGTVGSPVYFTTPVNKTVAQVAGVPVGTTSAGSFLLEGSVNGLNWETIIAGSSWTGAATTFTYVASTAQGPWSALRATLTTHSAGGKVSVWLDGQ